MTPKRWSWDDQNMSTQVPRVCPDPSFLKLPFPGERGGLQAAAGSGAAVPDVIVEVVPLLSPGHGESHFPWHGSHPAAGQVGSPGLGEGHTWQRRDGDKVNEFSKARGASD